MKNCKSTESLSQYTIYKNDCEISKYLQAKNKLAHLDWHFVAVG